MRSIRWMHAITMAAVVLAGSMVPGPASAQGRPSAPVGHRQPTASDVPADGQTPEEKKMQERDKELDKKLKSICRGC